MTLRRRMLMLCVVTLLGMAVLAAVALSTLRTSMMDDRIAQLSTLVTLAHAAAEKGHALEQEGKLSRDEAQAQVKRAIASSTRTTATSSCAAMPTT